MLTGAALAGADNRRHAHPPHQRPHPGAHKHQARDERHPPAERPDITCNPNPSVAMIGSVPSQNAAITMTPHSGCAVPAAMITKAYSHPHGSSVVRSPTAAARATGDSLNARICPALASRAKSAGRGRRLTGTPNCRQHRRDAEHDHHRSRNARRDPLKAHQRAAQVQRRPERPRRRPKEEIRGQPSHVVRAVQRRLGSTPRGPILRTHGERHKCPAHPRAVRGPEQAGEHHGGEQRQHAVLLPRQIGHDKVRLTNELIGRRASRRCGCSRSPADRCAPARCTPRTRRSPP